MYNSNIRYGSSFGNNRFVGGGFAVPFLLGGLTGGLLAPVFYPRPYFYPGPYYYQRPMPYGYPMY